MKSYELKKFVKTILREVYQLKENAFIHHNQMGAASQCSGVSHDVTIPDVTSMERDPLTDPILTGKLDEKGEKTEHFWVKWNEPDIVKNAGKIFLGDKWFANAVKMNKDYGPKYGNKWVINKHTEAFKLGFESPSIGFDNVQLLLDYLEKWYMSRKPSLNEQYRFHDFKWLARMDGFGMPTDVYYGSILLGVIVSTPNGYTIEMVKGPTTNVSYKQSPKNLFKTKDDAAKVIRRVWRLLRQNKET